MSLYWDSSLYFYAVTAKNANLCTYFILPLIGLNGDTLRGNFRNSYLSTTGDKIYVQVAIADMVKKEHPDVPDHRCIIMDWNKQYVEFIIPEKCLQDVNFFIQGAYSKMSEHAKVIIRRDSTLYYKWNIEKKKICCSDYRLIALDKCETYLNIRELFPSDNELEKAIEEYQELLSPPVKSSFLSF